MPRLKCTFAEFLAIIDRHGFVIHRQGATSHRRYRGIVDGKICFVDVAMHRGGDQIHPDTLRSLIRQSGLTKKLFRK